MRQKDILFKNNLLEVLKIVATIIRVMKDILNSYFSKAKKSVKDSIDDNKKLNRIF